MYKHFKALQTAQRIVEILNPACDRVHIAGSIRRKCSEVKDIEIVCQPKKVFVKEEGNLFGEGEWAVSPDFVCAIEQFTEVVEKGKPSGRYMKITLKGGMPLDLFMPQTDDYFRQLIIRTGSADYVHHVIAASWRLMGWCGTDVGLRRMIDCRGHEGPDGKTKWTCNNPKATLPPVWQSEEEVFAWLNLPFTPPECRVLKTVLNHYQ